MAHDLAQEPRGRLVKARLVRLERRGERFRVCHQLSIEQTGHSNSYVARLLMDRAFDLWRGECGFIDSYLLRLQADGDAPRLRLAAKRAGLLELARGNLAPALRYFNVGQYAAPSTGGGDYYTYDRDILSAIDNYPQFVDVTETDSVRSPDRVRVAYLVYGASHENSVLIRLLTDFIKHHDQSRFEFGYFSCDVLSASRKSNEAVFQSLGAELRASDHLDDGLCLGETETRLRNFAPDLLIGMAVLADYRNYYLFSRFPSVKKVALCYGPPAQYVPFTADFAISATWHPLIDCPVDGAVVEIEATLPELPPNNRKIPEELRQIPDEAVVVFAAGRSEKFSETGYWTAILEVLESRPNVYFVAVGLSRPPGFLEDLIAGSQAGERIVTVGWVHNYHDFLLRADVVVDTFPSGGGLTMIDAMAFAIPVVSFSDDYFLPFDQTNWNLGEELLPTEELIVPRNDISRLTEIVSRLVDDPALRALMGNSCRDHVQKTRGNPERMLRRIEGHYLEVMNRSSSSSERHDSPPACLTCRTGVLAVLASRLRSDLFKLKQFISRRFGIARG